jgi:hypothetical protein
MAQGKQMLLEQVVDQTLDGWSLRHQVKPEEIGRHILDRAGFWATTLPDGITLSMVRLYSPVVQRQEVFLGNVLLNDFLFQALPRAVARAELGESTLLLNDLENAYFLWRGNGEVEALRQAYQVEVLAALPDLYFGSEDPARGIHGDMRGMLTFYKCNIEPFPTFIMPQAYLPRLLTTVGEWLRMVVSESGADVLADAAHLPLEVAQSRRINVILSLLSFFYCRDGMEMQSFYTFLKQAMADGRLPGDQVKAAFGLAEDEDFTKKVFNERKQSNALNFEALAQAVEALLQAAEQAIAEGRPLEAAPQLGATKMLALSPEELVAHLLDGMQIGYLPAVVMDEAAPAEGLVCRFCGANLALIEEKNILGGSGTGNRFNQSLKRIGERFCLRCALSSYLVTKRLGMHFDGGFPVPKLYNVVFHYGRHNDWELEAIQRQIDYVLAEAGGEKGPEALLTDLQEIREEAQADGVFSNEAEIEIDWENWLEPSLEITAQMEKSVRAEVIPLGSGDYRLLNFILPQLRPGSREGLDFVQKRFSRSRLAVYTLLGLLRKLCGCDGPYYFQSLPILAPGGFDADTFYVNGQAENADAALHRYGAIINFARRVVKYRQGHSILADWILLAEQLEQDPLGIFSDVLRDSPIRGGDDLIKARYKRLSSSFVQGMGVVDATEYLALFEQLRRLQAETQP